MASKDGKVTLRFIMLALYVLALLCLAESATIIYLYAVRQVDNTMAASLILTFSAAQLTYIYLSFHAYLARRQRKAGLQRDTRTKLHSCINSLPRLMLVLWMAACAVGLFVTARQPLCRPGQTATDFWQTGTSCQLHRASVGMAVVAFVANCALFCASEVSDRRYYAAFSGIYDPEPDNTHRLQTSGSASSWSTSSSADSLKRSKLHYYREGEFEAELQRQKSLSTQPMYPPSLRYMTPSPLFQHGPVRYSLNPPATFRPQIPHPLTARSSARSSTTLDTSPSGPTRAPSSVSSLSASSSLRRSPLSTMRRASEPEVPLIPEKFRRQASHGRLTIPDAWPILGGPSLMSDPQIRAFSLDPPKPEPLRPALGPPPGPAPTIPPRDPKRMTLLPGRSVTAPVSIPTLPPSSYLAPPAPLAQPRIPLPTLPSSSDLATKRARPSRPIPQVVEGYAVMMNSEYERLRNQERARNVDFAAQNVAEAQRMRMRYEMARSIETRDYESDREGRRRGPASSDRSKSRSRDARKRRH